MTTTQQPTSQHEQRGDQPVGETARGLRRLSPVRRRLLVAAATAVVVAAGYGVHHARTRIPVEQTQFDRDAAGHRPGGTPTSRVAVNPDGTMRYLYDDFDAYGDVNSRLLEGFDNPRGLRADGLAGPLTANREGYQGSGSTAATVDNRQARPVTVRADLPAAVDLSRWAGRGYLTMWLNVARGRGIAAISATLGDATGGTRRTAPLPNLQTDFPDFPTANDAFPDLAYPEPTNAAAWTDFHLAPGWNFLPWRLDTGTVDSGQVDLTRISWVELTIATTDRLTRQRILFDDLRITDGLQRDANPVAGNWRPPLGMPQYGTYDVAPVAPGDYALRLLNVRQSQYPSNGDHGRLLSRHGTPRDFTMRVRFALNRIGAPNTPGSAGTNNTWLRVLYDFDPEFDPGHDWFGGYVSLDYEKFGLLTIIPIERFAIQAQEPADPTRGSGHRTVFAPHEGTTYEYQMTVHGQRTTATIYEVRGASRYQRASVHYTFARQRYPDRAYPLGIEITGNVKATVNLVELVQL